MDGAFLNEIVDDLQFAKVRDILAELRGSQEHSWFEPPIIIHEQVEEFAGNQVIEYFISDDVGQFVNLRQTLGYDGTVGIFLFHFFHVVEIETFWGLYPVRRYLVVNHGHGGEYGIKQLHVFLFVFPEHRWISFDGSHSRIKEWGPIQEGHFMGVLVDDLDEVVEIVGKHFGLVHLGLL